MDHSNITCLIGKERETKEVEGNTKEIGRDKQGKRIEAKDAIMGSIPIRKNRISYPHPHV